MYLLIGSLVALNPAAMEGVGIGLVTATGITTTRTWGALFAGVGLTGLIAAARRDWVIIGLLLLVLIAFCIVAARVYGIWFDGIEPRQWIELRREGIGLVISMTGLIMALLAGRKVTHEN